MTTTLKHTIALVAATIFLAGCLSAKTTRVKPYKEPPPYAKIPAQLEVSFSSQLPDIFMVLSGPGETYKPYPVNEWAETALRRYAKEVSSEGPAYKLSMTILTLRTTFETLGLYSGPPTVELVPARYGLDDLRSLEEIDPRLPQQIEKTISMGVTATLSRPGAEMLTSTFEVEASDIFVRDDDMADAPWVYDYNTLFKRGIDKAIAKMDEMVRGAKQL